MKKQAAGSEKAFFLKSGTSCNIQVSTRFNGSNINPFIEIGDYTILHDFLHDPLDWEKTSVLYHYPKANGDRLKIGRFCSIGAGAKFIFNAANASMMRPLPNCWNCNGGTGPQNGFNARFPPFNPAICKNWNNANRYFLEKAKNESLLRHGRERVFLNSCRHP